MSREPIHTDRAPAAIGTYSQAFRCGHVVYLSGQIGIDPKSGNLVSAAFEAEISQVMRNLVGVVDASGGKLKDIVKLNVYLTDMGNFTALNKIMGEYFERPYPARAVVGVASLPKGAHVEVDAIMVLD